MSSSTPPSSPSAPAPPVGNCVMWFAHKRVCGPASNPFRWPKFSKKEISDLQNIADKPFQNHGTGPVRCLWNPGEREERVMSKDLWQQVFPLLMGAFNDLGAALGPQPEISSGLNGAVGVVTVRKDAYQARAFSTVLPSIENDPKALKKYFFDALASKEVDLLIELSDNRGNFPFYSQFQHKYIFYFATIVFSKFNTPPLSEDLDLVKYTTQELERFYREVVANTHAQVAEVLLKDLST